MDPVLVYACSTNPGKLREFSLVAWNDFKVQPFPHLHSIPAPEEIGSTFEENALAKGLYYSGFTREFVLAEDSGIEIAALGNAPGIYSARYSGAGATDESNNRLLLHELASASDRRARYVSVAAIARNGQVVALARGEVNGEILAAPRGSGGFGYDPLFFYPPFSRSFAETSPEEKFTVSHRGQALRQIFDAFRKLLEENVESE